jgi:hypothetical protein
MTRGDVGTLEAHLRALADHAPDVPPQTVRLPAEIRLAEERGALTPDVSGASDRPCKHPDTVGLRHAAFDRRQIRGARGPLNGLELHDRRVQLALAGLFEQARVGAFGRLLDRRPDLAPLLRLRASWRSVQAARPGRPQSGRIRPVVSMRWSRPSGPVRESRSSAASAPWLA